MDEDEKADLISRLFALLTGKFEDGAALASHGQGRRPPDQLIATAGDVLSLAEEATTIAMATAALLAPADRN